MRTAFRITTLPVVPSDAMSRLRLTVRRQRRWRSRRLPRKYVEPFIFGVVRPLLPFPAVGTTMKRHVTEDRRRIGMTAIALVLTILLVAIPVAPALAWRSGPVVYLGFGPAFWAPFWWHPYYYYPYPSPRIVIEQPPVYIQQAPPPSSPPAVSAFPPPPDIYWYYCASAGAYYPTVPQCPEPWVKVPPRPPQ